VNKSKKWNELRNSFNNPQNDNGDPIRHEPFEGETDAAGKEEMQHCSIFKFF
jgi:hypothetical protein